MLKALIMPVGMLVFFALAYFLTGAFFHPADEAIHGFMTFALGFTTFLVVFAFAAPGFDLPDPQAPAN